MEFRLAAEGNTDELRQWLRSHPERVNVPAQGSSMTLLYTAISNANRTDLASLQAGHSRYLNTVRMLCEEYKADVLAPNGGNYNTALHLAASIGATDIVRYLVETLHTPVDRANVFGEQALQMAERGGFTECSGILRRAAAAANAATTAAGMTTAGQRNSVPTRISGAVASGFQGGGNVSRFHSITVSDSDEDEYTSSFGVDGGTGTDRSSRVNDGTSSPSTMPPPLQQQQQHSNNVFMVSPAGAAAVLPRPQYVPPSSGSGVLPATQLTSQRGSFMSGGSGGGTGSSNNNSNSGAGGSFGTSNNSTDPRAPLPGVSSSQPGNASSPAADNGTQPTSQVHAPLLPQPVRPRKEYDISKSRILANPDLQGFRSAYGDGFKYIQCSDHYEIRGILPYTYRGAVYYTPVIISVYAPASAGDSTSTPTNGNAPVDGREGPGSGSGTSDPNSPLCTTGSQRSGVLADGAGSSTEVYCRYRVCLDMQNLNNFAISRKAEYLDPISGAIIPAPGDDKYHTLTAYVRNVVIRSFESVPPLIVPTSSYAFPLRPNISQLGAEDSADPYRHHHSHNAPTFMRNALPTRTAAHIRCAAILRDLSKFGDGLGRYFPANHRIVAYVPVFSERKAAVLAMPQERPYTTTVDQYSPPASPGGGANDAKPVYPSSTEAGSGTGGPKKAVTQQVAVEAVVELQVRVWMQFSPVTRTGTNSTDTVVDGREGGVYAYPPRVYLVDAAARPPAVLAGATTPPTNALTGRCFESILRDRISGEVDPEKIKLSQESWSANGSVYDILVELQKVLRDTVESFAVAYTGRHPASAFAQQESATANSYGGGYSSGSPTHLGCSPVASPLDTFFASPISQAQPGTPGLVGVHSGPPQPQCSHDSAGHCLYCYQPLQTRSLLQPCGHDGMCGLCVQRMQSHCREEVFACPVCRGQVKNVMEVFL